MGNRGTLTWEVWPDMRIAIAALLLTYSPSVASAQSSPGVFGGYVYTHPSFENVLVSTGDPLHGWMGGGDVPIVSHIGVTARVDGTYGDMFQQGIAPRFPGPSARSALYTVTGGPRIAVTSSRLTLFADGLVGVAHGKARSFGIDFITAADDTKFVAGAGGGVIFRLNHLVDLQADLQYRRTNLFDQTLNVVQVAAGVVFRPTRR